LFSPHALKFRDNKVLKKRPYGFLSLRDDRDQACFSHDRTNMA
jgi:hypothetical protein